MKSILVAFAKHLGSEIKQICEKLNTKSDIGDIETLRSKCNALNELISTEKKRINALEAKLQELSKSGDKFLIYRRTQYFNFYGENNNFSWSGQQIRYNITLPPAFVGKFCEVFINGNIDARVPNMPETIELFSQDPLNKDEILIVAYEDSEHITDTLQAYGK